MLISRSYQHPYDILELILTERGWIISFARFVVRLWHNNLPSRSNDIISR